MVNADVVDGLVNEKRRRPKIDENWRIRSFVLWTEAC